MKRGRDGNYGWDKGQMERDGKIWRKREERERVGEERDRVRRERIGGRGKMPIYPGGWNVCYKPKKICLLTSMRKLNQLKKQTLTCAMEACMNTEKMDIITHIFVANMQAHSYILLRAVHSPGANQILYRCH